MPVGETVDEGRYYRYHRQNVRGHLLKVARHARGNFRSDRNMGVGCSNNGSVLFANVFAICRADVFTTPAKVTHRGLTATHIAVEYVFAHNGTSRASFLTRLNLCNPTCRSNNGTTTLSDGLYSSGVLTTLTS